MYNYIVKELDFENVFILPQPSSLSSRSQVNLERKFNFVSNLSELNKEYNNIKYNEVNLSWKGVPIIAANMDTTGTFKVYNALKNYKMFE
jgi:GMP reductase